MLLELVLVEIAAFKFFLCEWIEPAHFDASLLEFSSLFASSNPHEVHSVDVEVRLQDDSR